MSTSNASMATVPHIALLPSAGMGHLMPVLRLAAMLAASSNCLVSVITPHPTVSAAESDQLRTFFAAHPTINRLEFEILPYKPENSSAAAAGGDDPFFLQYDSIMRSAHLLRPLLSSSSPPVSAIFVDYFTSATAGTAAEDLSIPYYVVSTTSPRFFAVATSLPHLKIDKDSNFIQIPGLFSLQKSRFPSMLYDPNHLFTALVLSNLRSLPNAKGILLNTFDSFDQETITALNSGKVVSNLPPVFPIGPFKPYQTMEKDSDFIQSHEYLPWLNSQPPDSVVYVSFGSRTAMSIAQIREIGEGLLRSKQRFLWVLKSEKVDKDDRAEVEELVGESFMEKSKNRGVVVKGWVNQEEILAHPAIGGFVSHCGWNSVMEAARLGVPVLGWPLLGDQQVNAETAETAGLAVWEKDWGWIWDERLVKCEEIEDKIVKLMEDEKFRAMAKKVGEEATKAWEKGGSSEMALHGLIQTLSLNAGN